MVNPLPFTTRLIYTKWSHHLTLHIKGVKNVKKFTTLFLSLLMICSFSLSASAADYSEFSGQGKSLEKEMIAMIERGVLNGYGDDKYGYDDPVQRQHFAAFVRRVLELPLVETTFIDVAKSTNLAKEIGAVESTGIMRGTTDGKFNPGRTITREEMAITMSRVLEYKEINIDMEPFTFAPTDNFGSDASLNAVKKVMSAGLMGGYGTLEDNKTTVFKPKVTSSRAQAAAVWSRYFDLLLTLPAPNPTPDPDTDPEPTPTPTPEPEGFQVGKIVNKEIVESGPTFKTYAAALENLNSTQADVILNGNDILFMKSGIAYVANTSAGDDVALIYKNSNLTFQLVGVSEGREMKFLESTEDYIKVEIGGTTGYVSHAQADLTPTSLIVGKDRYIRNADGMLIHHTYNHAKNAPEGFYLVGPAPSFMQTNVNYTSYDGVHFYAPDGKLAGTHYPYFQFQSFRTTTDYTAEQLDSYIMQALKQREATNVAKFANATTKSKLIGMGKFAKEIEAEYHVNALFLIAAAIHESEFGMSKNAQELNNLYGIDAYDLNPETRKFESPEESMETYASEFAGDGYSYQPGYRANGTAPGNKTVGMNVFYATDPHWGSKVAGHMYQMDFALGKKDHQKHTLALTTSSTIFNVRTEPRVAGETLIFTYKPKRLGTNSAFGYPLVVLEEKLESDGYIWYKVLNDHVSAGTYGWVRSDSTKKIDY